MGTRSLRSGVVGLAVALGLSMLSGISASAADQLDQSMTTSTSFQQMRTAMAQTFTAGTTASLDRVSLMLVTSTGSSAITVQIQTVSGGMPSGTVLGTSTFTGTIACCNKWQDFAFSPGVAVNAGTQYAIVVRPTGILTWYDDQASDAYAGGQLWIASGSSWTGGAAFGYDFCFQTFVAAGAANSAPTVSANAATVTAPEGAAVTNAGTFADTDGDSVSITASAGVVTKSGASSGTWSWSSPAADEQAPQVATITADDGHGNTATVSFSYGFTAAPPVVSLKGAPATAPEGTAVTLNGSATSASAADNSAGFTYAWTVTKNGAAFAAGTGPTVTFTPDDEGTYVASLQASDDSGAAGTAAVTISGGNVAPTATISGLTHDTLVLVPAQAVTFKGGFTDPGTLDTHTATIDWGDHSAVDSYTFAAGASPDTTDIHKYAAAGTYTVTYSVSDDDTGSSTVTAKVTVETPAQALAATDAYVDGIGSLRHQEEKSLSDRIDAAARAAARGDKDETCRLINEALRYLDRVSHNGRVPAADAALLSSSLWAVDRALGCTKVRVGGFDLDL